MADKLSTLLLELTKGTRSGNIKWERTAAEGVYQVSFPRNTVQISTKNNPRGVDDYQLTILDREGAVIEKVTDPELTQRLPHASELMSETYATARRQVLGVDGAIDAILIELAKQVPF